MNTINLYLIDYYSPLQHNGLNTYIRELTDKLSHYSNINLHMIWVNAKNGKEIFYNEEDKSFLVPFDINISQEKDTLLKEYLKSHIKENENILFHFNWIVNRQQKVYQFRLKIV